ncbi:MAG: glycosyltransferase family 2 protein, partial [Acidocella sp.]|nr:glycosyltransferase family 2 protein [Acidocella sp.]
HSRLISPADQSFTLSRLDNHDTALAPADILGLIGVRNESVNLPYVLNHHRHLGVTRFIVIDDHSTDGTTAFLLTQPDVHVFTPSNSFKAANAGMHWHNLVLDHFALGRWVLTIDADELFVYPHCESINLGGLCAHLDHQGHNAVAAFMLDMYPDGDLSQAVYEPGRPFVEICPFFDADYVFRPRRQTLVDGTQSLPTFHVEGGPRARKFYPWQQRTNRLSRAALKLMIRLGEKTPLWRHDKPHYAPALIKMPLIKWHAGVRKLTSHVIATAPTTRPATITGALLHFKFFASFHNKAKLAIANRQHFNAGQEYRRYLRHIEATPGISFMYPGSRHYKSSRDLLDLGLIRTDAAFDQLARSPSSI